MASQPWLVQYQQPQFQQVYQGPEQQIFANNGQPYIQNGQNNHFIMVMPINLIKVTSIKYIMLVCKDPLLRRFHLILGMLRLT
jgi:hypothetical protein